ncbi:MAG: FecR domain-containing protein [Tannerella sp.]|jgi:ferric-dicitrate binding protein FerR (iron transport regulator)|nr:FecR domain-containing protein [Tannerella sp.]
MNEELLEHYFAGDMPEDEKRELFRLMEEDANLREEFVRQRNLLTLVRLQNKTAATPFYTADNYRLLMKKARTGKIRRTALQALKYAATAALAIGLWTIWQSRNPATPPPEKELFTTIETPPGQRTKIRLPDGSSVWLNSQTKLTCPSHFSKENRQVRLEGEAFFEVKSDAEHPFTVSSELMSISVPGTQFNVHAYREEASVVTLIKGRVEIVTPDSSLILKPDYQATVSKTQGITVSEGTPDAYAWIKGEFFYLNRPLKEIAADLERRFNVSIRITDATLAGELFTYHAGENTSIDDILRHLKKTKALKCSRNGREIVIRGSQE